MWRVSLGFLCLVAAASAGEIDFNRDIRPILSDNCIFCHGPDEAHREAKLRLDTLEGAREVIVPGEPNKSALIDRIFSKDPDERMPPPDSAKELDTEERELLKRWIVEGAVWKDHWAYVSPEKPSASLSYSPRIA
ncbi:MAG: putative membrane protein [Verrucomicrobiales bacterium]|jgi:uncharacterized membrane protein